MIGRVLYIGPVEIPGSDDHEGYVGGVTPDGGFTDIWTDPRTVTGVSAYCAACECGWRGPAVHPAEPGGHRAALGEWLTTHFSLLEDAREVLPRLGRPVRPDVDFLAAD